LSLGVVEFERGAKTSPFDLRLAGSQIQREPADPPAGFSVIIDIEKVEQRMPGVDRRPRELQFTLRAGNHRPAHHALPRSLP
jgi:hypothetical protein